ncbi:MAG: hypothetical protein ACM3ZO_07280, partial [Clostridia bacterium]
MRVKSKKDWRITQVYRCQASGSGMCGMCRSQLRIGVLTDIHAGCDHGSQLGSHASPLLEEFVREMGRFNQDL